MYSGRFSEMPQHGDRQLTSMTLQEIMDLQSDDGSRTNAQWRDAVRLHAVGRYQFIGSTLQISSSNLALIRTLGLLRSARRYVLYLLRTRSGIGQWVGPATHASMDEKEIVKQLDSWSLEKLLRLSSSESHECSPNRGLRGLYI